MEKILNEKQIKNKINNYIKYNIINNIEKNKIISISGINSKIKSILILLIISLYKNNKKILIINMDFLNNYLKNNLNNKKENIYYLEAIDLISQKNNLINYINILKKEFDIIIINTSHECFYDYNKKLIQISNENYFIIKNNNFELNKSINLFNIYINNWKIENKKIKIIINN